VFIFTFFPAVILYVPSLAFIDIDFEAVWPISFVDVKLKSVDAADCISILTSDSLAIIFDDSCDTVPPLASMIMLFEAFIDTAAFKSIEVVFADLIEIFPAVAVTCVFWPLVWAILPLLETT